MSKQFIPLFKKQSFSASYFDHRIVNVVSMAGVFQGGDFLMTPYVTSKHAADCFTSNLRLEMAPYDVEVCCVNPTFHRTPMANPERADAVVRKLWGGLTDAMQEEYGQSTFTRVKCFWRLDLNS